MVSSSRSSGWTLAMRGPQDGLERLGSPHSPVPRNSLTSVKWLSGEADPEADGHLLLSQEGVQRSMPPSPCLCGRPQAQELCVSHLRRLTQKAGHSSPLSSPGLTPNPLPPAARDGTSRGSIVLQPPSPAALWDLQLGESGLRARSSPAPGTGSPKASGLRDLASCTSGQ